MCIPDFREAVCAKIDIEKLNSSTFNVRFEDNIYKRITKEHRNWIDEIVIEQQFLKDKNESVNPDHVVAGGCFGFGVGVAISIWWCNLLEASVAPVWAAVKAIALSILGFCVGAASVAGYKIYTISKRPDYLDWKKEHVKGESFIKFSRIVENDEYLKTKVCPISRGFIQNPTITKCKHIFENSDIHVWLEENSSCPMCREPIHVNDLVYAENYQAEVCRRIVKLVSCGNLDKEVKDGMVNYLRSQCLEQTRLLKQRFDHFFDLHASSQISNENYVEIRKAIIDTQDIWNDWKVI